MIIHKMIYTSHAVQNRNTAREVLQMAGKGRLGQFHEPAPAVRILAVLVGRVCIKHSVIRELEVTPAAAYTRGRCVEPPVICDVLECGAAF